MTLALLLILSRLPRLVCYFTSIKSIAGACIGVVVGSGHVICLCVPIFREINVDNKTYIITFSFFLVGPTVSSLQSQMLLLIVLCVYPFPL